jgi:hypothetical protein
MLTTITSGPDSPISVNQSSLWVAGVLSLLQPFLAVHNRPQRATGFCKCHESKIGECLSRECGAMEVDSRIVGAIEYRSVLIWSPPSSSQMTRSPDFRMICKFNRLFRYLGNLHKV